MEKLSLYKDFVTYFEIRSGGVIVREYGQTLGLGLVDKNRTVVYY